MNRADRRRQAKQAKPIKRPAYHGLSADRKKEQLFRNGITADDLDREHKAGFEAGWKAANRFTYRMCYAAAALALRGLYEGKGRFGKKRIERFLRAMDNTVCYGISCEEEIDRVFTEIGIEMNFDNLREDE